MHLPHLRFLLFAFICLLLCLLKLIVSRPLSILYTLLALDTFISEHYDSAGSVPLGHSTSHCNWADSKYWKVLTLKEQFSLFICAVL